MVEYKNRLLASDIEAIGLYDKVNTSKDIHCLCSIDIESEEVLLFHDNPEFDNAIVEDPYDNKKYTIPPRKGSLQEGITFWEKAKATGEYSKELIQKINENKFIE